MPVHVPQQASERRKPSTCFTETLSLCKPCEIRQQLCNSVFDSHTYIHTPHTHTHAHTHTDTQGQGKNRTQNRPCGKGSLNPAQAGRKVCEKYKQMRKSSPPPLPPLSLSLSLSLSLPLSLPLFLS